MLRQKLQEFLCAAFPSTRVPPGLRFDCLGPAWDPPEPLSNATAARDPRYAAGGDGCTAQCDAIERGFYCVDLAADVRVETATSVVTFDGESLTAIRLAAHDAARGVPAAAVPAVGGGLLRGVVAPAALLVVEGDGLHLPGGGAHRKESTRTRAGAGW